MMILRSFTGPFDLTSDGNLGRLTVSVPEKPARLQDAALKFFAQRVADRAQNAKMTLSARFGDNEIIITRKLSDLSLSACKLDGNELDLPEMEERERLVQDKLSKLMGVGSFVDVLLLLHHVVLLHEERLGALWDQNAQRHVLRILFLDREDASQVARLERFLQSADSQGRNIHARITATKRDLHKARQREGGIEEVVKELRREQELLEADQEEIIRLDGDLFQLDEDRRQARLELERAKIEYEEAVGALERLKYTTLLRLFPKMVAMDRVGGTLARFAAANGNHLVVTSNLSNSGLITALFGGPTSEGDEVHIRKDRTINLLRIAAPNRSLINDRDKYQALLDLAFEGIIK